MNKTIFNRRNFLLRGSLLLTGLLTFTSIPNYVYGSNKKKSTKNNLWPYSTLDPIKASKLGYDGYYEGECCYGAASAILNMLAEKFENNYINFPKHMFYYGRGGAAGWGTLCGALNGASAVINLIVGEEYKPLVNELIGWYTLENFPSNEHDSYSKFQNQAQSIANSPLCHISVTKWCKKAGVKEGSKERSDRCAKVTGDVAKKAVLILNDWHANTFKPEYSTNEEFADCIACHVDRGGKLNNSKGTMNCISCHERHEL